MASAGSLSDRRPGMTRFGRCPMRHRSSCLVDILTRETPQLEAIETNFASRFSATSHVLVSVIGVVYRHICYNNIINERVVHCIHLHHSVRQRDPHRNAHVDGHCCADIQPHGCPPPATFDLRIVMPPLPSPSSQSIFSTNTGCFFLVNICKLQGPGATPSAIFSTSGCSHWLATTCWTVRDDDILSIAKGRARRKLYTYTYTYIHTYIHTCMHTCIHIHIDVHIYITERSYSAAFICAIPSGNATRPRRSHRRPLLCGCTERVPTPPPRATFDIRIAMPPLHPVHLRVYLARMLVVFWGSHSSVLPPTPFAMIPARILAIGLLICTSTYINAHTIGHPASSRRWALN